MISPNRVRSVIIGLSIDMNVDYTCPSLQTIYCRVIYTLDDLSQLFTDLENLRLAHIAS